MSEDLTFKAKVKSLITLKDGFSSPNYYARKERIVKNKPNQVLSIIVYNPKIWLFRLINQAK